jgi:hypothetical protein
MQPESARRRPQTQQARPVTTRMPLSFPTSLLERVGDNRSTGTDDLSFEVGLGSNHSSPTSLTAPDCSDWS